LPRAWVALSFSSNKSASRILFLKYGGVILYKRLRPFFLGLILGQISGSGFWSVIDYITGGSGNIIYVGMLI
jgi:hypothetical protein